MPPAYGIGHLEFNRWATLEVLNSVENMPLADRAAVRGSSYGGIQGTLVHLCQADAIWFDRLQGHSSLSLERYAAPEDPASFRQTWTALLDNYVAWGASLPAPDWERNIPYRNTRNEPFAGPTWQIILHIVNHGSYHRGQIITMMRQVGAAVVSTDLIHYYRAVRKD